MNISRERNSRAKGAPSSSSRVYKNPRIVGVSREFGGKDRHSKVCTVRGLRDRRIRLSVPSAIQLYDLQHRLGMSQPSKVIDWLLDTTKHDIDKLPPLPIIIPHHQFQQPPIPIPIPSPQNPLINNINQSFFPNYNYFQWPNLTNQTANHEDPNYSQYPPPIFPTMDQNPLFHFNSLPLNLNSKIMR